MYFYAILQFQYPAPAIWQGVLQRKLTLRAYLNILDAQLFASKTGRMEEVLREAQAPAWYAFGHYFHIQGPFSSQFQQGVASKRCLGTTELRFASERLKREPKKKRKKESDLLLACGDNEWHFRYVRNVRQLEGQKGFRDSIGQDFGGSWMCINLTKRMRGASASAKKAKMRFEVPAMIQMRRSFEEH
jgi:hypothetical protein